MSSPWPWLAVAALGVLHGLNPASGWMFAVASAARAASGAPVRRALLPIAIGHVAAIAIVALAVTQGLSADRMQVQGLVGALLVAAAGIRWWGGDACKTIGARMGGAGIALGTFLAASAHGVGLMLVPALVPLCGADTPARAITASGSLALAGAAVALHLLATLATTAAVATGICRGIARFPRLSNGGTARRVSIVAWVITGAVVLLAPR